MTNATDVRVFLQILWGAAIFCGVSRRQTEVEIREKWASFFKCTVQAQTTTASRVNWRRVLNES